MSSLNRDGAIWAVVAVVLVTLATVYLVERPEHLTAVTLFQVAETIVTIDGLLLLVFVAALWPWPMFAGWLVRVPDLRGRWRATITPILDGEAKVEPIAASLDIRQTLFALSCVMRTERTSSRSFAAALFVDSDSGEQRLTYSYSADPQLRDRELNARHDGTAVAEILKSAELVGTYFTDRLTRGELHFWSDTPRQGI